MSLLLCQAEGPELAKDGAEGIRTPDLRLAKAAFSQLNYGPGGISDCKFRISDFALLRSRSICNRQSEISNHPVGLCGLEPQTFPLSEGCSNQLS